MCYGMRCGYEDHMGECTWDGGLPYPCPSQEREMVEDQEGYEKWCVERYYNATRRWMRWIRYLHSDIGKDGSPPTYQEWKDYLAKSKELLASHDGYDDPMTWEQHGI